MVGKSTDNIAQNNLPISILSLRHLVFHLGDLLATFVLDWPQAKHVSQGCRFCLPLLPPGGLFWPNFG